ncbi:MAG: DUF1232 domain-containing protein [Firmicutes bacterium]|nr:DUF1232 domain-containing protein [Bacillota bacterium]MBR6025834.1 DUF1232 domain-containing protein [Bacillota bacterium]
MKKLRLRKTKTENPEPKKAKHRRAKLSKARLQEALDRRKQQAAELIKDEGKLEEFLQKLEAKLKTLPTVGNELGSIPLMISLLRSYIAKEYTKVPATSIVTIVGALIYFAAPFDIVPDILLGLGFVDDAAIIGLCLSSVFKDLDEYEKWRKEQGKLKVEIPEVEGSALTNMIKGRLVKKLTKK